jgi:hypothetical protein
MHMFGYQSDYGNLTQSFSSQSYGNFTEWVMSIYQNDHYPYSAYGSCSKDGRMGFQSFHNSAWYQKLEKRINVQSIKGRRPRRQFNVSNSTFTETQLNNFYGLKSGVDLTTYLNFSGHATNNNGAATYDQTRKILVIYYPDSSGSNDGYLHTITGSVDLMTVGHVKEFFDSATFKRTRLNNATNWGFDTLNYNVQLFVGDNDYIGMDIRYNETHYYRVFDCSGVNNASVSSMLNASIGNTTSYGSSQGMMYRGRFQQTWDGDWGCFYGPYYYYGCGVSAYFMSKKNPLKYYRLNITEGDYGGILTPSGTRGFSWLSGRNTDGEGIHQWGVDFSSISDTEAAQNNVTSYIPTSDYHANYQQGAGYSNGDYLSNSFSSGYGFSYPGYHYSTSYPIFMTVDWWEKEGGYAVA